MHSLNNLLVPLYLRSETLLSFGEILDRKKPFIVNLHYAHTPRALALERDPTSLFKVSLNRDATNLRR
jgi:hypothetical protein